MRIPQTENQADCQKVKKSIWQLTGQSNKLETSAQFPLSRGLISSRTLKLDKTRLFKPCNTLNRVSTRSQNNSQNIIQDENKTGLSKENSSKQNQKSTSNNENIIGVLGQLEQYERIKINSSSKVFNNANNKYQMDVEYEGYIEKPNNKKQINNNNNQQTNRLPLSEINSNTNQIFSSASSLNLKSSNNSLNNRIINIEEENEDDKNERLLIEKFNQKTKTLEKSLTSSIASTNLSSSSSSLLQVTENNQNNKCFNVAQSNIESKEHKINSLKKQPSLNSFQMNEYLDGYKVYKKGEKLFTFKIFKEDFLKIPAEYSKVITHSQDDDVSSDEDVVRGGMKFNYKSILKEIYSESDYQNAPQLVISSKYFA